MHDTGTKALKKAIENSGLSDSIVIWGASKDNDRILQLFAEWGFTVAGYIDRNYNEIKELNGIVVFGSEQLSKKGADCPKT